jgi:hypothetical protein
MDASNRGLRGMGNTIKQRREKCTLGMGYCFIF